MEATAVSNLLSKELVSALIGAPVTTPKRPEFNVFSLADCEASAFWAKDVVT